MALDEQAKKDVLRLIPSGIFVVGTRNAEVRDEAADLNAYIGSWVTQCSFKPPMVAMGLRRGARGHEMIRASRVFSLNFPDVGQKETAARFMRDLEVRDGTMAGMPYRLGATGTPLFEEMGGWLECEVVSIHDDGGDHDVAIGRIVAARFRAGTKEMLTTRTAGWSYGG